MGTSERYVRKAKAVKQADTEPSGVVVMNDGLELEPEHVEDGEIEEREEEPAAGSGWGTG